MQEVVSNQPQESGDYASPAYDITRSQAFGPNRRIIQEEIDLLLHDLRSIYRWAYRSKRIQSDAVKIANRLKILRSRFDA